MAIQVINIGSSANKGDGDPLRTAFKKINENFAELNTTTTNTVRDMQGSVFGDDSTLLVDAVNSLIPSSVLSGNLPAIDGSALTGIVTTETDPIVGAITGIVKADGSGNISAAVAGTDYLTTVAFADITSKPTTVAGYGITDAFDGAYGSLTGAPTIPTAVSQLTNDSSFLTSVPAQTFASITSKPTTLAGYGITDGAGLADVISDTTPQLGGNLDLNSQNITQSGLANTMSVSMINGISNVGTYFNIKDSMEPKIALVGPVQASGNNASIIAYWSDDASNPGTDVIFGELKHHTVTTGGSNGFSRFILTGRNRDVGATAIDFFEIDHTKAQFNVPVTFNTGTSINFDNATITNLDFSDIASKPSTISGYGITDAYTKTEVDNLTTTLDGDLTGSVFGDDSTLLVDGNNNKIVGAVDTTSLRTSETKIALGSNAGQTTQGGSAVAIGRYAGQTTQGGSAVAIGYFAGLSGQGQFGIAIGNTAGQTTQSTSAVAIGQSAGNATQGQGAVAVGTQAGLTTQGTKAIAIGYRAGETSQAANSIVLNATGLVLNNTVADTFVVKPVREVAGGTLPTGFKTVGYNPTTGEFIYLAGV